jgi:hypothetical protein
MGKEGKDLEGASGRVGEREKLLDAVTRGHGDMERI